LVQLRPDLHENTDDGSVEHSRTNELQVGGVLSFGLDFDPFSDLVKFAHNKGTVGIARSLDANQRGDSGRKIMPKKSKMAGIIWRAQGARKAPVPLMKEHPTDELSSLAWRSDLRDVDRNLGGADANTEAVDYTTDDEHGDVLRSADDDAANNPDDGSDLDCDLAYARQEQSESVIT
ncbi:hypothetical protein KCU81_g274, partial [Aureobasidium melanogenum]